MTDEYNFVAKGKLKLKTDSHIKKKKKKSKDKEKEREALQKAFNDSLEEEAQRASGSGTTGGTRPSGHEQRKLTKAEQAFKQQQENMRNKRIMEKANTTHKQRVAVFNEHLDRLTEHFDIPKVSWTK